MRRHALSRQGASSSLLYIEARYDFDAKATVAIDLCCENRFARSESVLGLYMPNKAQIRPQNYQRAFL